MADIASAYYVIAHETTRLARRAVQEQTRLNAAVYTDAMQHVLISK